MNLPSLFVTTFGFLLLASPAPAENASHGAETYKLCAGCHGFSGEGNRLVNAPSIAGLESWYIERQLRNFRDGVRGHADDDQPGRTMGEMAQGLDSDGTIDDLVAYIESLPAATPDATLDGDHATGQAAYAACSACHGANGRGNQALHAPALVTLDDWYQLEQLEKFRDGRRGAEPSDTYGQQMVPMAKTLADEQAMKSVIAYIRTLAE